MKRVTKTAKSLVLRPAYRPRVAVARKGKGSYNRKQKRGVA
jgi:stalled ribosome alternative rescue factor ArfA